MMRDVILLACASVLLLPCRSAAQQVAFAANIELELDSATQLTLTRAYARARDRGLPVEPLMAKVREGRLKRAAGPLISAAVTALATRLDSARAALGPSSREEELVAGADAIFNGAHPSSLRMVRAATTRPIAAPLGTLAQLLASGVDQKRAVSMIVVLLRRAATPAQILALGTQVESDVRSGLRADESAAFRLRAIESSFGSDAVSAASPVTSSPSGPPATNTSKPTRKP